MKANEPTAHLRTVGSHYSKARRRINSLSADYIAF